MPKPVRKLTRAEVAQRIVLSPAEVACLLEVSSNSVYNYLRDGELPSTKIGNRRWIPAAAVLALFDAPPSDDPFEVVSSAAS